MTYFTLRRASECKIIYLVGLMAFSRESVVACFTTVSELHYNMEEILIVSVVTNDSGVNMEKMNVAVVVAMVYAKFFFGIIIMYSFDWKGKVFNAFSLMVVKHPLYLLVSSKSLKTREPCQSLITAIPFSTRKIVC